MSQEVSVNYEATPNPHTYKFNVSQNIAEESVEFEDPAKTGRSPLASKLFGFPWAESIFVGPNFVSVTKQDWVGWDVLAEPLCQLIKEHIESGTPVLLSEESTKATEDDDPVVQQIKTVIDNEIRPAVAMDGGDIVFQRYENNIVYIYMRGACSGCPSATVTLKQGIEARLMEVIPEIKEVVAL